MAVSIEQFAVALEALKPPSLRREPRTDVVRIVEYSRFPRTGNDATPRVGFTRDLSAAGMCIGADDPEPVGSLLRVTLRELDGRLGRPGVDRVAWCHQTRDGRYWIGLERLTEKHSR